MSLDLQKLPNKEFVRTTLDIMNLFPFPIGKIPFFYDIIQYSIIDLNLIFLSS